MQEVFSAFNNSLRTSKVRFYFDIMVISKGLIKNNPLKISV
jgi:hypothetical protein